MTHKYKNHFTRLCLHSTITATCIKRATFQVGNTLIANPNVKIQNLYYSIRTQQAAAAINLCLTISLHHTTLNVAFFSGLLLVKDSSGHLRPDHPKYHHEHECGIWGLFWVVCRHVFRQNRVENVLSDEAIERDFRFFKYMSLFFFWKRLKKGCLTTITAGFCWPVYRWFVRAVGASKRSVCDWHIP